MPKYTVERGVPSLVSTTCDTCTYNKEGADGSAARCLFHLRKFGAFRKPGGKPKNAAVRIITDKVEGFSAVETFMSCILFNQTMLDRYHGSQETQGRGEMGEIVEIIGGEGSSITCETECGFNLRGEIVKPQAEIKPWLKKSGHKVNETDLSPAVEWRKVTYERIVPALAEAKVAANAYQEEMLNRARASRQEPDEMLIPSLPIAAPDAP